MPCALTVPGDSLDHRQDKESASTFCAPEHTELQSQIRPTFPSTWPDDQTEFSGCRGGWDLMISDPGEVQALQYITVSQHTFDACLHFYLMYRIVLLRGVQLRRIERIHDAFSPSFTLDNVRGNPSATSIEYQPYRLRIHRVINGYSMIWTTSTH